MLTSRQKRFIDEYLIDRDAMRASKAAAFPLSLCGSLCQSYVYALVDPGTREIFYIGKGTGRRYEMHVKQWRSGCMDNAEKFARIGAIVASGQEVLCVCLADYLSPSDALMLERDFIQAVGLDLLANRSPGEYPLKERWRLWACDFLERIKPYDRWVSERKPTANEKYLYWAVRHEAECLAAGETVLEHSGVNTHGSWTVSYER